MAHFARPRGAARKKAMYGLNRHRHVKRITVLQGKSADVMLCLGDELDLKAEHKGVLKIKEGKPPSSTERLFTLTPTAIGKIGVVAKDDDGRDQTLRLKVIIITQNDLALSKEVVRILRMPAVKKIKFTIDGFTIHRKVFAKVRKMFRNGAITVRDGAAEGSGAYRHTSDEMFLSLLTKKKRKSYPADRLRSRKALIVHEATHALLDAFFGKKMTIRGSEAAGYLAGNVFLRAIWPKGKASPYSDQDARVHRIAWDLAGKVLDGESPSGFQMAKLKQAVLAVPEYRKKVEEGDGYYHYDGV